MYQVLARKWRPKNFAEVIGQEHVVRALSNSLQQQRLHHAYLFSGTRGVGKTTIARILAKCLNCLAYPTVTATPCGQCDACQEIDAGRFADLIEVDAASRTKVEDTRDLLDNAQYLPVVGRYKVYLIDEVHMLSGHSFNALLKTLEEPPEHVKFLLATTDPQKLPVTVLSRCLQFNLKKLPYNIIQQQLNKLLQAESIPFEELALSRLAVAADGSVRDALSLLDQAIAYGGGAVKLDDVCNMLGIIDKSYIWRLLENLATNNGNAIMTDIAELASLAKDFNKVLDELLQYLQQIAIIQTITDYAALPWENTADLQKLATLFSPEDVQLYYQIALIGKRDLPLAPTQQSGFEMVMLRMLTFRPQPLSPTDDSANLAPTTSKTKEPTRIQIQKVNDVRQDKPRDQIQITTTEQKTQDTLKTDASMEEILAKIKVSGPTASLLQNCTLSLLEDSAVTLLLNPCHAALLNKNQEERLQKAFSELMGKSMRVNVNIGTNDMLTPAVVAKTQQDNEKAEGLQKLTQNNKLQKILSTFNATIVEESVKIE